MPIETVLLIRHARSVANDDPSIYEHIPDHAISLAQPDDDPGALLAAQTIARLRLPPDQVCAWCSTYVRCAQTEAIVLRNVFGDDGACRVRRRPSFLLREQEFGDWDRLTDEQIQQRDPERWARRKLLGDNYGKFYFRYPGGESRADVTQRIHVFAGKLNRSDYPHHLVFLHGVTQRAFRMAWLDLSVDWFEEEPNPPNASVLQLSRDENGWWRERYL